MLPTLAPPLSGAIELRQTPFYAQAEYQCGPAALATVLNTSDVNTTPEALVDQVYVPAKKGSLQVEMLAATRRAGRIPYPIEPSLSALRAELDASRPVLVLQNLGLNVLPVWHYAVVIGLDPAEDAVILRSGTERREQMPAYKFLRSWRLAKQWGIVVLHPGELPIRPDPARLLSATAMAEPMLTPDARQKAYHAALEHWPTNLNAQFGYASALYDAGKLAQSEREYRKILARHPRHAAVLNNLAEVQNARGCRTQAIATARQALSIAQTDQPALVAPIQGTLDTLTSSKPSRDRCRSLGGVQRNR